MRAFMGHVLRGLATVLPPVLTLIVLLWMGRTLDRYILRPIHTAVVSITARAITDVRTLGGDPEVFADGDTARAAEKSRVGMQRLPSLHAGDLQPAVVDVDGREFVRLGSGEYVPAEVRETVVAYVAAGGMPRSARRTYEMYVEARWLQPTWFMPACFVILVGLTYFAGRVGNRNLSRMVRTRAQTTVGRVPLVSRVYATVKQVVLHVLAGPKFEQTRVVAVEFPRKGAWTIAYVINEGLAQVADRAREPVLTLFFDTSPLPMSGYTIMVPKSQTIPINMALDDALKFVMSCGIIVPSEQDVRRATRVSADGAAEASPNASSVEGEAGR